MYEIGNIIDNNIELSSQDYEIIPLNILLHGTEALIIYFIPFTFGVPSENSFDSLLMEINKNIQKFNQNDIRTIFVTREPPNTNRHWSESRKLEVDVFSDPSLEVSNKFVGTFDVSLYFLANKGVNLGSHLVPSAGVVAIGRDGNILGKLVASSPDQINFSINDIFKMVDLGK